MGREMRAYHEKDIFMVPPIPQKEDVIRKSWISL